MKNLPPLVEARRPNSSLVDAVCYEMQEGMLAAEEYQRIVESLPNEMLRELVRKVAGTDESFLITFKKQVALVDAVINQLVDKNGNLRPSAEDVDISLKDALTISNRVSEMMVRHLPKLYTVDRIQRMERAIGDVMEEFMTVEQQQQVLERLHELTSGGS